MRVVLNTKTMRYEIHRGLFTRQVWQDDPCYSGGYWWTYYPENATKFSSPEEAMRVYNNSRKPPEPSSRLITVKRFW